MLKGHIELGWGKDTIDLAIMKPHIQRLMEVSESTPLSIQGRMFSKTPRKYSPEFVVERAMAWRKDLTAMSGSAHNEVLLLCENNFIVAAHSHSAGPKSTLHYVIYGRSFGTCRNVEQELLEIFDGTKDIGERCDQAPLNLRWFYTGPMGIQTVNFDEMFVDKVLGSAYPYIPDLESYINEYINGEESVIVLHGPPGTGKTRLIRKILRGLGDRLQAEMYERFLRNTGGNELDADGDPFFCPYAAQIGYTTSEEVIKSNDVYLELLGGHIEALVLEDLDFHLGARTKGNTAMYQLLAASDGLITGAGRRKVIVSTNLENRVHIDQALLRPGRCYDTLSLRLLKKDEARTLASELGSSITFEREASVAEVYYAVNHGHHKPKKYQGGTNGFKMQ